MAGVLLFVISSGAKQIVTMMAVRSRVLQRRLQRDAMKLRPQCLLSTSAVACAAEDVRAEILRRQQWRPSLLDEAVWFGGNGVRIGATLTLLLGPAVAWVSPGLTCLEQVKPPIPGYAQWVSAISSVESSLFVSYSESVLDNLSTLFPKSPMIPSAISKQPNGHSQESLELSTILLLSAVAQLRLVKPHEQPDALSVLY
nr:hypothetical protein Iba_chr12aCG12810 [Ipomoea batatas]